MPRRKSTVSRKIVYWTSSDLKTLRQQAGKKSAAQLARLLKRTAAAVQRKAMLSGISLRRR